MTISSWNVHPDLFYPNLPFADYWTDSTWYELVGIEWALKDQWGQTILLNILKLGQVKWRDYKPVFLEKN